MLGVIPINKKQKEVELAKLTDEEKELNHLKAIYGKASEWCCIIIVDKGSSKLVA